MKRSEINGIIKDSMDFALKMGYHLPPFAFWTPEEWAGKSHEYDEIRENMLGWDITDWSMNDFKNWGLVLFTVRNGNVHKKDNVKVFAEKMLVMNDGQSEPFHYHWNKVEDIVNRCGGTLIIKLYNATDDNKLADTPVHVAVDGRNFTMLAGCEIELKPGESLTIFTRQFHKMWAKGGKVLAAEISNTNDDQEDNCFLEDLGRFPSIEEDEPPAYLLCNEYPKAK